MVQEEKLEQRIYILDTNVLLHEPSSVLKFDEHTVFIPLTVMEELDKHKKGHSELARNARQAHRYLDEVLTSSNAGLDDIQNGVPIGHSESSSGTLMFQTFPDETTTSPDNAIIEAALKVKKSHKDDKTVILVTKDINMRIKAMMRGILSEDYKTDNMLLDKSDSDVVFSGQHEFESTSWDGGFNVISEAHIGEGKYLYEVELPDDVKLYNNMHLCTPNGENFSGIVRNVENNIAKVETCTEFRGKSSIWGLHARNNEQNFAMNALMDKNIDIVTLLGGAGTGKTLLTIAAAMEQVIENNDYDEIIATRATIPIGNEIGFLPGEESDKMMPWMGAIQDNIEFLLNADSSAGDPKVTMELATKKINMRSMSFIRGRSYHKKFIIVDEAQNLTAKEVKTFVTRVGEGTKIVFLGNLHQIDTPYLTEATSGLSYLVERMKHWEHSAHIVLKGIVRSRVAEYAAEVL